MPGIELLDPTRNGRSAEHREKTLRHLTVSERPNRRRNSGVFAEEWRLSSGKESSFAERVEC